MAGSVAYKSKPKKSAKVIEHSPSHAAHSLAKAHEEDEPKNSQRLDKPLLESVLKRAYPVEKPAVHSAVSHKPQSPSKEEERKSVPLSTDEEKINVLEIASDLEKQLDVAFSIKEAQAQEIDSLKEQLKNAKDTIISVQDDIKALESALMSQEALQSKVEFLESERIKACEEIENLEQEQQQKKAKIEEAVKTGAMFNEEKKNYIERIEFIETDLDNTKAMLETLRTQNMLLKNEKDALSRKLNDQVERSDLAIADKERSQKELDKARESLEEIRLMLSHTKAKAQDQYIKSQHQDSAEKRNKA